MHVVPQIDIMHQPLLGEKRWLFDLLSQSFNNNKQNLKKTLGEIKFSSVLGPKIGRRHIGYIYSMSNYCT